MKYNELQVDSNRDRKRVGRGIAAGGGKTAGRGTKGQKSRTGKKIGLSFAGGQNRLISSVPKSKGFKSLRTPAQVVYLDRLEGLKGKVDNLALYEAGLISTPFHTVKVIARGELTSKLDLRTQGASASVVEAVKKAGGTFEKTATPIQSSAKKAEEADKKS